MHLESWAASIFVSYSDLHPKLRVAKIPGSPQFFLGLVTIGPWAFLILLDATIWLYRMIVWELPWIGGRARGRQRPRAPTLNERPDGQRRAFGLRGVEGDGDGDDSKSELGNILDLGSDGLCDPSRMNATGLNSHPRSAGDGILKQRTAGQL